ncbi:phosphoserine phosphatase SerB [Ferrimonas marina]|uniref:Phosphoserine phosphatase n=1 Tax=Ferrimonas marina TaxID=299255 RepID=A0A1M5V960_9GAMM|nr:phosphoserine phosphatase SerB [Ferrimonas marina]SHH71777.1 phosphoserine phosphatase [Ferrimonas marina]
MSQPATSPAVAQLAADLLPWDPALPTWMLLGPKLEAESLAALAQQGAQTAVVAERIHDALERVGWQGQGRQSLPEAPAGCELLALPAALPKLSQPGLLLMDMDSTAIAIECIDEIARRGGCYDQVAEVTELAMQGGLEFAESLRQRVAMLKGIPVAVMDEIAADLPLNPGLERLCLELKQRGWRLALASGGFNRIAGVLAERLGLDYFEANDLAEQDGLLTGEVEGGIVDAERKAAILQMLGQRYGIARSQWVALGDGANDLPMLAQANLGVGFRAKPAVAAQVDAHLGTLGLDAVLGMLAP